MAIAAEIVSRSLRMKAIVTGKNPTGSRLLPMCRVELLGIERARIELRVTLNIRIFLAKCLLVINVYFDSRRHPTARHLAVVFKANVLKLAGIGARGFK